MAYVYEASPNKNSTIYEYKTEGFDYEAEEEKDGYYENHEDYIHCFGIFSANDTVYLKHHEADELGYDDTTNYGIGIRKVDGEYEYRWGNHGGAACMTPPSFDEFHDLSNPVNQLVIEVMKDCIVFE